MIKSAAAIFAGVIGLDRHASGEVSPFWANAWRLYKKIPASLVLGLMGSMVVVLSHGLVDHAFFLTDLAFAFFLIVGIAQKLWERQVDSPAA